MDATDIVMLCIWIPALVAAFFIHFRNSKVHTFRTQIIREDFDNAMKALDEGILKKHEWQIDKLPSYSRMIFSFKPLEKKYWL